METLLVLLGLGMILFGANILTDGSAKLSARFGISEFIVGLTVVAIGTSAPELVVSLISAIKGNGDIAVGNIVGSNIFNVFVILGVTALILPVELSKGNIRRDIPFAVGASAALCIVASFFAPGQNDQIGRVEGAILLLLFLFFLLYTIRSAKQHGQPDEQPVEQPKRQQHIVLIVGMILAGLGLLIYGGTLFLDNAVLLAEKMGISQKVIAVTLMAGGTSMPELAACVVAALKGKSDMALGNIVGSNIFNILLILGASAVVTPLTINGINDIDLLVVLVSSVLLFLTAFTFKGQRINRIEGALFILLYASYIFYILHQ